MTNRVLDLAERPARLSAKDGLLVVETGEASRQFPLAHLAVVVCSHPQIVWSQPAMAQLAESGGLAVVCNAKHQPVAMTLPLAAHSTQTARFQAQASAGLALRKRLWRQIVAAKVLAQSKALERLQGRTYGLEHLARRVRVANASTLEATASRVYWPLVFEDSRYRRGDDLDSRNGLLNYGYAIVRAVTARALCAAGLHPCLPLHHHNKYDPFPLANDLMEPFRPLVDEWVARWCSGVPGPWPLDGKSKASLLGCLTGRFKGGGESRSLFDWVERVAECLTRCLEGKQPALEFPSLEPCDEAESRKQRETAQ